MASWPEALQKLFLTIVLGMHIVASVPATLHEEEMTNRYVARILIGIFIGGAGIAHFTNADWFKSLVPDSLGEYRNIINSSTAILMILMGLLFIIPGYRAFARWSGVALLLITLPAAINQVIHPDGIIAAGLSPTLAAMRVLAQVGMIALILWATKEENPKRN